MFLRHYVVGSVLAYETIRAAGQTSKQNTKSISSAISFEQISGKKSESK